MTPTTRSQDVPAKARCTATTRKGKPCHSWPTHGSNQCAAHGGTKAKIGAPPGNKNAQTHGAYAAETDAVDLDARIRDLNRRINQLSHYIDKALLGDGEDDTITITDYGALVAIYGQLTSRLGRLLRDQQQLGGGSNAELEQAIADALDMAGEVLGVEL